MNLDPDRAGVRARAASAAPARARRLRDRGTAPWLARRPSAPPRRPLRRGGESAVEPYRVTPKLALRVAILGGVLLAIFAALFLRLWALQVLAGQKYVAQAQANSFRILRVPAPRGLIVDRNGVPLVTNTPSTAIQLWPSDLPKVYVDRYAELARLARSLPRAAVRDLARHQGAAAERRSRDPRHGPRVGEQPDGQLPARARGRVPRRLDRPRVPPPLPVPGSRRAGARLRRLDHADAAEAPRAGLRPERRDRPDGRGVRVRQVPAAASRARQKLHVDNLSRPLGPVQTTAVPKAGQHRAPDAQREAPAGRREARSRTGSTSRRGTASGRRAAARSSRSIRATARSSRWRRRRRTSRRSTPGA